MRKSSSLTCALLTFAFLIVALFSLQVTSAQIPHIPRPSKPKPTPTPSAEQPTTDTNTPTAQPESRPASSAAAAGNSAAGDDQPLIAKDSVQVTAYKVPVFHGNFDTWSWVPRIEYRVNGPIPSGSQLYVEFSQPSGPWVKFDCQTNETQKGHWWKTECGGRDIPEDKSTTYTGPLSFAIKMRNELAGTDATLFTGKFKVGKIHSNEVGPHAVNRFIYYVDQDWTLPIGYLFLTPDDVRGWNYPGFNAVFWVRGEGVNIQPHLFYQGKEVGKIFYDGEEVGKASCESDFESGTMTDVDDAQRVKWSRVICRFPSVKGYDKTGEQPGMFGPLYMLAANPGDYELKVLWQNHLARSIKFTVKPDGNFDNGIAAANKLGSDRVIVPVQIIGEQDGQWNKLAWKTEAFYSNPLTGFNAP